MQLLLETHLLLWAVASSRRLAPEARSFVEDPANDVFFSAASLWEIAIKSSLRRRDFRVDVPLMHSALSAMGLTELPVRSEHAVRVTELPPVHRDPFDRLLLAQSLVEQMVLLTNDALLARYGAVVRVV